MFQRGLQHRAPWETKGVGICLYINKDWCTNCNSVEDIVLPSLETLMINYKLFYLRREFFPGLLWSEFVSYIRHV